MSEKNANNVDQIRDLIFGAQIKDFEEKFNQLHKTLQATEEKIKKHLIMPIQNYKKRPSAPWKYWRKR